MGAISRRAPGGQRTERRVPTRREIERFCAAVRVGAPLGCGPEKAIASARACLRANEEIAKARTT